MSRGCASRRCLRQWGLTKKKTWTTGKDRTSRQLHQVCIISIYNWTTCHLGCQIQRLRLTNLLRTPIQVLLHEVQAQPHMVFPKFHFYPPATHLARLISEPNYEPHLTSEFKLRQMKSQSEGSPSVPTHQPLRRSNTSSARLDALRGVYASMADGASQIPMSELLQATRLVHRIGVVLTEQMGKKMGDLG